jgi:hypothetical protein
VKDSRVWKIVDNFSPTAANYSKATDNLKGKSGRKELLNEFYVSELMGLVVKNATSMKSGLGTPQLHKL